MVAGVLTVSGIALQLWMRHRAAETEPPEGSPTRIELERKRIAAARSALDQYFRACNSSDAPTAFKLSGGAPQLIVFGYRILGHQPRTVEVGQSEKTRRAWNHVLQVFQLRESEDQPLDQDTQAFIEAHTALALILVNGLPLVSERTFARDGPYKIEVVPFFAELETQGAYGDRITRHVRLLLVKFSAPDEEGDWTVGPMTDAEIPASTQ